MNKISFISQLAIIVIASRGCFACDGVKSADTSSSSDDISFAADTVVKIQENSGLDPKGKALLDAYPGFIAKINDNTVIFKDGTSMPFDDGKEKDFETRLDNSDIEDMFFVKYRTDSLPPEYLADAGRSRCEELFKKMYGASAAEVGKNLVTVPWFGKNIKFTSVNGGAEQLRKVAEEIAAYPELKKYVDCSGTFYWRPVRGAKRLSAHSYGIAIDIGVKSSDYWLWKNPKASETSKILYANRMPRKLVEIFERHGFIWGGAWYHYDTMHFEYRPEIIAYSKQK